MLVNNSHVIWYEKYRPQCIDDLVLPQTYKQKYKEFIAKPYHLLLSSLTPGTGKTSTVNAIIKEGQFESLFLNASLDNGIDTLRSRIQHFASTQSLNDKAKIVVLDEIDNLSQQAMAGLRGFIEEFSANCAFIGTCNYPSKILPAIVNRFCHFDYDAIYRDSQTMIPLVFERLKFILSNENITYQDADVVETIKNCYPSFRDCIGSLQKSVTNGAIQLQISNFKDFDDIINAIKSKNYETILKSVYQVSNAESFYSYCFDYVNKNLTNSNVYVILAKYQYQNAFARDPKLNLVACCVELMNSNF